MKTITILCIFSIIIIAHRQFTKQRFVQNRTEQIFATLNCTTQGYYYNGANCSSLSLAYSLSLSSMSSYVFLRPPLFLIPDLAL